MCFYTQQRADIGSNFNCANETEGLLKVIGRRHSRTLKKWHHTVRISESIEDRETFLKITKRNYHGLPSCAISSELE